MNGVRPEVGCRFIFRMIFFKGEKDEVIKRKKKGMRPLLEGSLTDVRRGRKWNIIGRIKDGDIPFFSADIVDTLRFSAWIYLPWLGGGSFTIRRVGVFMFFFSEENSESIMAFVVLSGIFGAAKMRESLERKVVCRLTLPVLPFSQC